MSVNSRLWELFMQLLEQLCHCSILSYIACVFGLPILRETADIADAYTIAVVTLAVRTYLLDRATFLYGTVKANDIVITYIAKTALLVPTAYSSCTYVPAFWSSRTVNDDLFDLSHNLFVFGFELNA